MRTIKKYGIFFFTGILMISCNPKEKPVTPKKKTAVAAVTPDNPGSLPAVYKKGEQVPNELVCMVNDAYMGKKQMEVPFDGKMYYGCCDMCVKRIPEDATVRMAVDAHTGAKVDKATAFIVLLDEVHGNVAYFESEKNYQDFMARN